MDSQVGVRIIGRGIAFGWRFCSRKELMKLEEIWILHHSHTDIGFTLEQPVLWEMQRRFIDMAIDAAERHAGHDEPHAFKWVVETVAPLLYWLDHSPDRQIERFRALEKAGRIEIAGAFLNVTPLADAADYAEMLQPVARLRRDYGFTINHVQNADVNGHNWTLVESLLNAGITSFSMAINFHYGGYPFQRPNLFNWQGPSGRHIPTFNNWCYPVASWCGLPIDQAKLDEHVPLISEALKKVDWPLPVALLQGMAYGGDNSPADITFSDFIQKWNDRGAGPRLRMVTWREFWQAAGPVMEKMPTHAGDWTDYWNFGSLTSARETAVARRARSRLRTADLLHAGLQGMGVGTAGDRGGADHPGRDPRLLLHTAPAYRQEAWRNLETWHEHTWGACTAGMPRLEFSTSSWQHKAKLAWQAHSLSLLLARDGAAELAIRSERNADDALVLYNPLPWARTFRGDVVPPFCNGNPVARGYRQDLDASATRHGQDSVVYNMHRLDPVTVPACGYTMVPKAKVHEMDKWWLESKRNDAVIEDEFRRIEFDTKTGGVLSWFDKGLKREMVDATSPWRFGSVVHEEVDRECRKDPRAEHYGAIEYTFTNIDPVWRPDWKATRRTHTKLVSHRVFDWPDAIVVEQVVEVPGLASPATLSFILPRDENTLEVRGRWDMGLETWPEATYFLLPFAVPAARVRYDIGGVGIEPERQQLPGTCRDYFHLQNWVDFSGDGFGVTIATPENPVAQFGDFHFAHAQKRFKLERALFLGWITNNYWVCNFPGHQPGQVTARYIVRPHGGYDETAAHRFGLEAAMPCVVQNALEAPRPETPLPRSGSLLKLPDLPVLTLHALPGVWSGAGKDGILLRFMNASDEAQAATVGSGILQIAGATLCDAMGAVQSKLRVRKGEVQFTIPARDQVTVRLVIGRKGLAVGGL